MPNSCKHPAGGASRCRRSWGGGAETKFSPTPAMTRLDLASNSMPPTFFPPTSRSLGHLMAVAKPYPLRTTRMDSASNNGNSWLQLGTIRGMCNVPYKLPRGECQVRPNCPRPEVWAAASTDAQTGKRCSADKRQATSMLDVQFSVVNTTCSAGPSVSRRQWPRPSAAGNGFFRSILSRLANPTSSQDNKKGRKPSHIRRLSALFSMVSPCCQGPTGLVDRDLGQRSLPLPASIGWTLQCRFHQSTAIIADFLFHGTFEMSIQNWSSARVVAFAFGD
jgi:hypothetical protein